MLITTPQSTYFEFAQIKLALKYLQASPTAALLLSTVNTTVLIGDDVTSMAFPLSNQVIWNFSSGLAVIDQNGVVGVQSPAMGLMHELLHVITGRSDRTPEMNQWESQIARELGEPTRVSYEAHAGDIWVNNSTQHTQNGQWKVSFLNSSTVFSGPMWDGSNKGPSLNNGFIWGGPGGPPIPGSASAIPAEWYTMPGPRDTSYPVQLPGPVSPRLMESGSLAVADDILLENLEEETALAFLNSDNQTNSSLGKQSDILSIDGAGNALVELVGVENLIALV